MDGEGETGWGWKVGEGETREKRGRAESERRENYGRESKPRERDQPRDKRREGVRGSGVGVGEGTMATMIKDTNTFRATAVGFR